MCNNQSRPPTISFCLRAALVRTQFLVSAALHRCSPLHPLGRRRKRATVQHKHSTWACNRSFQVHCYVHSEECPKRLSSNNDILDDALREHSRQNRLRDAAIKSQAAIHSVVEMEQMVRNWDGSNGAKCRPVSSLPKSFAPGAAYTRNSDPPLLVKNCLGTRSPCELRLPIPGALE